jgi:hypothetical protein
MDSLSLPIVHPAFEKLKRSGRGLHFIAAVLIVSHAASHARQEDLSPVYFWCQLIIALDIFLLVFAGRNMLIQLPKLNLFFRLAEVLFFLGIATVMLSSEKWGISVIHFGLGLAYSYLFYCERKAQSPQFLSIHHIGVNIPGLPENRFLLWSNINRMEPHYHSIRIETSLHRNYDFELQKNLSFEELEQIHDFCRHYLTPENNCFPGTTI